MYLLRLRQRDRMSDFVARSRSGGSVNVSDGYSGPPG
jgi:hypothetical protein